MLKPGLLPILNPDYAPDTSMAELIEIFLDCDQTSFLLCDQRLRTPQAAALLEDLALLKQEMDFDFLVYDPPDLASLVDASGAVLTSASQPVAEVVRHFGPHALIGCVAHTVADAIALEEQGARYVLFGPVFESPDTNLLHPAPATEVDVLAEACRSLAIPVLAAGGIRPDNLPLVRRAGAHGFCAVTAVYANGDIEHNIAKLNFIWTEAA